MRRSSNSTESRESEPANRVVLSGSPSTFEAWLHATEYKVSRHCKILLDERDGSRESVVPLLREIARSHYVSPKTMAKRLANLGAPKTAALLRETLPTSKRARSGDLGEILATEFVNAMLDFEVPIRRLQWKDGREMALRGDDLIGVAQDNDKGELRLLKGEAKSRANLSVSVVKDAAQALNRNQGRPSRHAVLFVANRLRELGQDDDATALENAVLEGFRRTNIQHLLFVFCGNDPDKHLTNYLKNYKRWKRKRNAIGLRVKDHGEFIRELYEEM